MSLVEAVSGFGVWALHFLAVYALVGVGCERTWDSAAFAGSNSLTWLLIAVTLPALGAIAWIGVRGWRATGWWRRDTGARAGASGELWRFTGLLTVTVAALAFLATLMTALPVLMLPPCR